MNNMPQDLNETAIEVNRGVMYERELQLGKKSLRSFLRYQQK